MLVLLSGNECFRPRTNQTNKKERKNERMKGKEREEEEGGSASSFRDYKSNVVSRSQNTVLKLKCNQLFTNLKERVSR